MWIVLVIVGIILIAMMLAGAEFEKKTQREELHDKLLGD